MVQNGAQSINITQWSHLFVATSGLLGRHIAGRTEGLTGERESGVTSKPSGKSEVSNVRSIECVNQNISGLEITMNDPLPMAFVYRVRQDFQVLRGTPWLQRLISRNVG